jgi:WXG100 family type VII secretion target
VTGGFRVDPDQLLNFVDQIDRFDQHLEAMLDDVDTHVNRLHAMWTGAAADEHQLAHDKWKRGAQQMRQALAVMRRNAVTAHANYTSAASTNVSMWEQAQ